MQRRFLIAAVLIAVVVLTPVVLLLQVVEDGVVSASPVELENYLWISDGGDLIYQVTTADPETIVDSYDFGTASPFGVWENNGYVFFVDYADDVLYKKLWNDKSEDNQWDIGGYSSTPYGLAYGGGYFWIANRGSDEIFKVDPADPTNYLGTFDYNGIGYVSGLDWNSDNSRLLVSDDGSALFYSFDVSTVPTNQTNVTLAPDWTKSPPAGAPTAIVWDGTYFWTIDDGANSLYKHYDNMDVIATYNPPGTDPQGLAFGFYVDPPVLVSPKNGFVTDNNTPIFVWENSAQVENYRIEVDNDADFSSQEDIVTVFDNTWTKTGDGYDIGTYYWRVWGVNEYMEASSDTWKFEVVMAVFYSTSSDGFLWNDHSDYPTAWNATTADDIVDTGSYMTLGQWSDALYSIRRSFVFFDTSTIPDAATITSATLALYGRDDRSTTDFNIVIQNGQPDYPSDPLVVGDYDRTFYFDNGGQINTENFITNGYNTIILNDNVNENWIRKDNTTKLAIRSSREIDGTTPSAEEQVDIWANEGSYKPILGINYTVPEWNLVETWTGTVEVPAAWQLIETWIGTIEAPVEWQLIETWTGTVEAPAAWQLIETWSGTIEAPVVWGLIETWTGTVEAFAAWQTIETWTGTVEAPAAWQTIETWMGTIKTNWSPIVENVYITDMDNVATDNLNPQTQYKFWVEVQDNDTLADIENITLKICLDNENLPDNVVNHYTFRWTKENGFEEEVMSFPTSIIGTSTVSNALRTTAQRKNFYGDGYYWQFYSNGENLVYSASSDGISWGSETFVAADVLYGQFFAVFYDESYVYLTYITAYSEVPLLYRRGTLSGSTINWGTEYTVKAGEVGVFLQNPMVVANSDGLPFIIYQRGNYKVKVSRCDTGDGSGTWTEDQLLAGQDTPIGTLVVLTAGKIYAIYSAATSNPTLRGKLWSGSAWVSPVTITDNIYGGGRYTSATNEGDNIHLVFITDINEIRYIRYDGTDWGIEVVVQSEVVSNSLPVISIDTSTNDLYCFWAERPFADYIYYKKCVSGTWDASPTEWVDESSDGLTGNSLTSYYKSYDGKMGLAYMTKSASPYNVKFGLLKLGHLVVENSEDFDNTLTTDNIIFTVKFDEDATVTDSDNWDVWVQVYDSAGNQDNRFFLNRFDIVVAPEWQLLETWSGSLEAYAEWQLIETWTGTIEAPVVWQLIEQWTSTIETHAEWQTIETWSGTIKAPIKWQLIETWSGTVDAPVAWQLIETWSGTVQAPVEWNLIETWTGIVEAPAKWQLVETWTGTVEAPVVNVAPVVENVYITDMDNVAEDDLIPQTQYKFWVELQDNDTLSDIENVKLVIYLDNENLPDAPENHYTFEWTKEGGFEEAGSDGGSFPVVAAVDGGSETAEFTEHTVNLPSGIQSGDLLLVIFAADSIPTISFPGGWTQLFQTANSFYITFGAWYRIADGGEGATITVTTSLSTMTAHISYRITGYSGVPEVGTPSMAQTKYPDPPSLTPSWGAENTLWLAVCGYNFGQYSISVYPSGYGNGLNEHGYDDYGCGAGSANRGLNTATEDPGTFTITDIQYWVANTVAIRPSVGVEHLVVENSENFDNTKTTDNIVFTIKFGENATITGNDNWDVWVQVYDSSGDQDNRFFLNRFDIVVAPEWQLIETWSGSLEAYAEWQLIETWTGTIEAPVVWQLIETWTGAIKAPAAWQLIETWSGTVKAYAEWQLLETWTGTVEAPVVNVAPVVENVYITDMDNVAANDLTPQIQYKFWVELQDNNNLSDVENVTLVVYLDNENLPDAQENHYTFQWTKEDGFAGDSFGYENVGSSFGTDLNDDIHGSVFTITEDGTADSITWYGRGESSGEAYVKCAIYKTSDNTLVGETERLLIGTTITWYTHNFPEPKPSLVANTEYAIVAWFDGQNARYYYDGGVSGDGAFQFNQGAPNGFPDQISFNYDDRKRSIYCTYTPTYLIVENCENFDNTLTTDNIIFTIKFGENATLTESDNWDIWVQVYDNYGDQDNKFFLNQFDIVPPPEWQLVEEWDGGIRASEWSVTTWQVGADTDDAFRENIDDVITFETDSIYNRAGKHWHVAVGQYVFESGMRFTSINIPQGAIIDSAVLSISAYADRSNNCNLKIEGEADDNAVTFSDITDYDGRTHTSAMVVWDITSAWTTDNWEDSPDIASIIQEIVDRSGWSSGNAIVLFWMDNGSPTDQATVDRIVYSYDADTSKAPKLTITYKPPVAQWNLIESWTGTIQSPAQWQLLETWTGTVEAPAVWQTIESWSGTIGAPSAWQLLETWSGSLEAPAEWQLLETWTGTIEGFDIPPIIENVYITGMDNVTADDLAPQTQYKFWVELQDNDTLSDIENVTLKLYLDNENLPDAPENHYTFLWTKAEGFKEPTFGYTEVGSSYDEYHDSWWPSLTRFELTEDGTVTKITWYGAKSYAASTYFRTGIYDDISGSPGSLLVASATVSLSQTPQWWDSFVDISLTADNYWLAVTSGGAGADRREYYDTDGYENQGAATNAGGSNQFPSPFGTPDVRDTSVVSIYATYTPTYGLVVENCENFDNTLTTDNIVFTIKFGENATITGSDNWDVWVQAYDSAGNQDNEFFLNRFDIVAAAEWQLLETWSGTVEAPAEWQTIETWTGTIEAFAGWQLIETWSGTVEAYVEWQLLETWTGTIEALDIPPVVENVYITDMDNVAANDLTPQTQYKFWVELQDNDTLADIENVKLMIYLDNENLADAPENHYTFWWRRDSGFEKTSFGNENQETSTLGIQDRIALTWFTSPKDGTVDSITTYLGFSGGADSTEIRCAIYEYITDNDAGNLIDNTEERSISTASGWYTFNFDTPPSLSADTKYFLAVWAESTTFHGAFSVYKTVTSRGFYIDETYTGVFPDPLTGEPAPNNRMHSIYATYTSTHLIIENCENFDNTLTTDNIVFTIKFGENATLTDSDNWDIWVQVYDSAGNQDNEFFLNRFDIVVAAEWQLLETWSGTVEAPAAWQTIETWTGTVDTPAGWQLTEEWTGTVKAYAEWQLLETWTGTVEAPAVWGLIETWSGTIEAPSAWQLLETWSGTVEAPAAWQTIETWTGTVDTPAGWQLTEEWTGTVKAYAEWQLLETWSGTVEAYVEWQLVETWDGTIKNPEVAQWNLIETWSGTIEAFAEWQLLETWTGTIQVPTGWLLIETWTGTVDAPSPWQLIETWSGTVSTVGWRMIEMWTGTIRSISLAKVTTESATSVSTTSATLNATILYGSYASVNVQFEYRIVGGSWMETSWEVYTLADYSKEVSSLSADTNYEFKAHITYDAQENYGTVRTFKTESTYVPPGPGPGPIPIPVPTPGPLVYDILLRVIPSEVTQGAEFKLLFDVWRVSGVGVHDIILEHWITGPPPDNKIYVQEMDTQAISARVIERNISTDGWPTGAYLASARITWANGIAESSESFEITTSWWAEHKGDIMSLVVIIIVLVIVAIGVAGKKKASAIIIGIKRKLFSLAFYKLIHGMQVPALRL